MCACVRAYVRIQQNERYSSYIFINNIKLNTILNNYNLLFFECENDLK
jgi:hypothetical protein